MLSNVWKIIISYVIFYKNVVKIEKPHLKATGFESWPLKLSILNVDYLTTRTTRNLWQLECF